MALAGDFSRNISLTSNNGSNISSLLEKTCNRSEPDSSAVITLKTVILCTIMFAALIGNAGIIIVFVRTKTLRKTVNFFLVNMAVADCLTAGLVIPREIAALVTRSYEWRVPVDVGLVLCKGLMIMIDCAAVASILSMVCLAIDRFCAVVLPMNRNLITSTTRKGLIIVTWVLAFAYSSPYLYTMKMISVDGANYCLLEWGPVFEQYKAITVQLVITVSLFGVLPWILVGTLYAVMVVEIKKSKHTSQPKRHSSRQRDEIDTRVIKLSLAIVLVFAVCNFPVCSLYLVVAVAWNWQVCPEPIFWNSLWFIAQTLVLLYPVLNPCVCFKFSENFRKGFKAMLPFEHESLERLSFKGIRSRSSKTTYIDNQNPSSFELSENALIPRADQQTT